MFEEDTVPETKRIDPHQSLMLATRRRFGIFVLRSEVFQNYLRNDVLRCLIVHRFVQKVRLLENQQRYFDAMRRSSAATTLITDRQSESRCWEKIRIDGYQSLSCLAMPHRHSP